MQIIVGKTGRRKKKWWCEDVLWGKKKRKEGFWGELCDEKVGL